MFEITSADYSLLSWVYQAGLSAHALTIRFQLGSLVVRCQTLEQAVKLWETRSCLQMPGRELCFQVDGTVYIGAMLG